MESRKKQKKGYSLIELLIVISIIGVAATLSWSGLSTVRQQSVVDNACDSVAVMANKARSYALAGIHGGDTNNADSIRFECSLNTCAITSSANAGSTWTPFDQDSYVLQNMSFDAPFSIIYTIPYATAPSGDTSHTITLADSSPAITKTLITSNFKASCQ
jgi:prepilin-type N-terminal cleavage/methylation domain-containing protein